MNRGGVTPAPEQLVSYANPDVFLPYNGGMTGLSALALFAAAALGGLSTSPAPLRNGLIPTATALIAAGFL